MRILCEETELYQRIAAISGRRRTEIGPGQSRVPDGLKKFQVARNACKQSGSFDEKLCDIKSGNDLALS